MNVRTLSRGLVTLGLVFLGMLLVSSGGGVAAAMATTLLTDDAMQNAMKIIFDDKVVDNSVTDSEILDFFQEGGGIQEDQNTGGRWIETAQMFALPSGVGFRPENGYIPIPGGPTIENSRVYLKEVFGSIEMSGKTMRRVRSNEGAFMNYLERALPGLRTRLTNELDRVAIGYGAGIKARVNAASPATTLVVDSAMGIAGWGNAVLHFLEGETLRASPNADGSSPRATTYTVEQIDFDNSAIVVDAVTNLVDNDYLFAGDAAGNSAGEEAMGLTGIVDDGGILSTFQNISRSSYPRFGAYVLDVPSAAPFDGNTTLTEDVVHYADDQAYVRNAAKVDCIVTSRVGFRQCFQDLRADRSFNDPRAYQGGPGDGITIVLMGRYLKLKTARKLPDDVCFGLTKSTLKRWFTHEWEWDTTDGSLWKQVTDATGRKHAFWAYGHTEFELGSSDPQKNWRIEGWNVSSA